MLSIKNSQLQLFVGVLAPPLPRLSSIAVLAGVKKVFEIHYVKRTSPYRRTDITVPFVNESRTKGTSFFKLKLATIAAGRNS
jgi:hypothetical protein